MCIRDRYRACRPHIRVRVCRPPPLRAAPRHSPRRSRYPVSYTHLGAVERVRIGGIGDHGRAVGRCPYEKTPVLPRGGSPLHLWRSRSLYQFHRNQRLSLIHISACVFRNITRAATATWSSSATTTGWKPTTGTFRSAWSSPDVYKRQRPGRGFRPRSRSASTYAGL